MSQTESSIISQLLTFTGISGAMLLFAMVLYVAYLPGRPPAVDQARNEERTQAADEARAEGLAKITGFERNEETGIIRIPIEDAMNLTVAEYRSE